MGVSEHTAVITEMREHRILLKIARETLPVSFRSRSVLPISSASHVSVEVDRCGRDIKLGDTVSVLLEERTLVEWSIFLTSILPILLFWVIYSVFYFLAQDIKIAGIGAAVLLFPYYSFLWLLRNHWRKVFIFRLK